MFGSVSENVEVESGRTCRGGMLIKSCDSILSLLLFTPLPLDLTLRSSDAS